MKECTAIPPMKHVAHKCIHRVQMIHVHHTAHIHVHILTSMYIMQHACTGMNTHTHAHTHTCIQVHTCTHMHNTHIYNVYICACRHTYTHESNRHIHLFAKCIHTRTRAHIYTLTYTTSYLLHMLEEEHSSCQYSDTLLNCIQPTHIQS